MILSYSVSNFKSIKQKSEISFKAAPLKSHKLSLINDGSILPIIVLYGPNGGGKSSLIQSLLELTKIVKSGNELRVLGGYFNHLKNNECKDKPIVWEINFLNENNEIFKYELSLSTHIYYEKLTYFKKDNAVGKIIFERKENELVNCCETIKESKIKFTNTSSTYLYYISNILDVDAISFVMTEFKKIITFESLTPPIIDGGGLMIDLINLDYSFIKRHKNEFIKIFKETDINIKDFEIIDNSNGTITFNIIKENSWGEEIKLLFKDESKGTQKFIQILSYILKHLYNGSYFVIDELDISLHTKLLGYIIKVFTSGKTNSQLLYSSHDVGTLSTEYFRKDEIYFCALNESKFTDIVCLNEFDGLQIRDKSSFSNIYLSGKIGYDPYIDCGLEWIKNEKEK